MKCPECGGAIPMPDLACDCPEPTCTQCHNELGHPGSPCPDCPGSHGYFRTGWTFTGYPINAICATCDGTGKIQ